MLRRVVKVLRAGKTPFKRESKELRRVFSISQPAGRRKDTGEILEYAVDLKDKMYPIFKRDFY